MKCATMSNILMPSVEGGNSVSRQWLLLHRRQHNVAFCWKEQSVLLLERIFGYSLAKFLKFLSQQHVMVGRGGKMLVCQHLYLGVQQTFVATHIKKVLTFRLKCIHLYVITILSPSFLPFKLLLGFQCETKDKCSQIHTKQENHLGKGERNVSRLFSFLLMKKGFI